MKLVRTIFLIPSLLLACSLFSGPASPSPTAVLPTAVTLLPLPLETPTETPTSLPAVTLSAADFTPVLYRRFLSRYNEFQIIGGVQEGNWLPAGVIADKVQFEQAYDLYGPNGFAGLAVTKDYGIPLTNPRCGDQFIGTDFSADIPNLIGVKQGWKVTSRPWQDIAVDTPVYYSAVVEWLFAQGFTLPIVQITRILRVDLEGDGVDEVFISASHFEDESGHLAEEGDYSIILMRKIVGSEVVTVPVVADLYTVQTTELNFPFTYSLASLLDLNQDGILELISEVARWEGNGLMIYEIDGTSLTQVLGAVCTE